MVVDSGWWWLMVVVVKWMDGWIVVDWWIPYGVPVLKGTLKGTSKGKR